MYNIEILDTIRNINIAFYRFGFWDSRSATFCERGRKIFHIAYSVLFLISLFVGIGTTKDKDEILLAVISIIFIVNMFKMFHIILHGKQILTLIHQTGNQSTNNQIEFIHISNKLKFFNKFVKSFMFMSTTAVVFIAILPIISHKLTLNVGFPLEWKNSRIGFWMIHVFVVVGCTYSLFIILVTIIIWYLMINCAIKYEMLGNQLRNIGTRGTTTETEQEKLFLQKLILAIKTHQSINKTIGEFTSCYGSIFYLQISTSSAGICGSIFILAFNSADRNIVQNGLYCLLIVYNLFDIFVVMYLGNEIKLFSDRLSYCLYESNWIEQTQLCKKYIVVMSECLKRPKVLIVGKLFPLNMVTFTSIVKGAYSLINLLQNLNLQN